MSLVVTPLELPERWDEPGPRGDAFRAFHAHAERSNAMRFGPDVVARSPEERLASLQPSLAEACRVFVAHRDGQLVGALKVYTPLLESTDVAEIVISAEPDLPDAEVLDLVDQLTTYGEQVAAGLGRSDFRGGSLAAASGAVTASSGFGGADPHHPEVAPLVARGYVLEQVYRISMVDLAALPDLDERVEALLSEVGQRAAEPRFVHGDLAPTNVLVDDAGRVTAVLDFSVHALAADPVLDLVGAASFVGLMPYAGARFDADRIRGVLARRLGDEAWLVDAYGRFWALYYAMDPALHDWCAALLR